jgi:hypothetical protein
MGLLTQEDPIGIAGGLNLYGFAGGDPINFSDPFGLKVRFVGDNAEQLEEEWNALRDRAREAMGSGDKSVRRAGRLLSTTLEALEADEETIWIGSNSSARPGLTTATFRDGELSTLAIGINKQMFGGYSANGRQEVLAHESGHAFHFLNYPRNENANKALAIKLNNAFRTVIGCTPQLTAHRPQTICR